MPSGRTPRRMLQNAAVSIDHTHPPQKHPKGLTTGSDFLYSTLCYRSEMRVFLLVPQVAKLMRKASPHS